MNFILNRFELMKRAAFYYFYSWRKITSEGNRYTIRNPLVILKRSGVIKLTDGSHIPFNDKNKWFIFLAVGFALTQDIRFGVEKYRWNLDTENLIMTPHQGIRFHAENIGLLEETFLYQVHFSGFDMSGKTVITAGAYIGDTPLFYSYYGAKVIALEPDPKSFKMAMENISINPELADRITLLNYALGNDGFVNFPVNDDSGTSSIYHKGEQHVRINSVSVSTLIKEFDIQSPYLLDIDIKGSEFEVIEDPSLSKFKKIRIEYSPFVFKDENKSLMYLLKKLEGYGFRNSRVWKHNALRFDLLNHGTIDAEKEV